MSYQNNVQPASRLRSGTARRRLVRLIMLVGLLSASMQVTLAQTSVLQGTVSVSSGNGSGERLPGASVNLIPAKPREQSRSAVTNEQGEYKFTDLAAGTLYAARDSQRFQGAYRNRHASDGVATTIKNIALEVADVSATVTVVADGDGLNTSDTAPPVSFNQNKLEIFAAGERALSGCHSAGSRSSQRTRWFD